jgi:hypothetical protein
VEFSNAPVDPAVARQLPLYGNALLLVFAMRMAAVFVLTTSNIGRTRIPDPTAPARTRTLLPRWFTLVGYAVGLALLLSATFSRALVLVFPVWVTVLCVLLITRALRIPAGAELPATATRPAPASGR